MRQPRVARTLLLLTLVFVIYASVYPLHLHTVSGNFIAVLLATWRARLPMMPAGDVVGNILLYTPVGFLAFFSLAIGSPSAVRIALATCFGIALSVGMESVQLFEVDRFSSFIDVVANSAGTVFGAAIAAALDRHSRLLARPAPLLLFSTWIGATILLILDRDVRLSAAVSGPFAIAAIAALFLLAESLGRRVPLRAIATLLFVGLVWRELQPFRFSTEPQSFHWIPFATSLAASRGPGILVFMDKIFFYGAAVWFCRGLTRSLHAATLLIAGSLAVLETIQMYIPGHTPESSDAVLALVSGFVLSLLTPPPQKTSQDLTT
jgi:VanZ family protein